MKVIGIIPARYASTRFPGKPLAVIDGKTMIRRVYEQASAASFPDVVLVATDDERIRDEVQSFGGRVVMTSPSHSNGTSRCLEAVELSGETFDVVINIQGDEPFIDPGQIDSLKSLFDEEETAVATLVKKIDSADELFSSDVVKCVFDHRRRALYFSRQALPFVRETEREQWLKGHSFYKHIGIYAYRMEVLRRIVGLKPGLLEQAEKLEQLRWLENGIPIRVELTEKESLSVDTPDDLLKLTNKP